MAVVRPELTTLEAEQILYLLKQHDTGSKGDMRLIRVFEREVAKAHEVEEWDRRKREKIRRNMGTSKEKACPHCFFAPPLHAPTCPTRTAA